MNKHPQSIVTPARTGAAIGLNRRNKRQLNYPILLCLLAAAAFAGALGLIAGAATR